MRVLKIKIIDDPIQLPKKRITMAHLHKIRIIYCFAFLLLLVQNSCNSCTEKINYIPQLVRTTRLDRNYINIAFENYSVDDITKARGYLNNEINYGPFYFDIWNQSDNWISCTLCHKGIDTTLSRKDTIFLHLKNDIIKIYDVEEVAKKEKPYFAPPTIPFYEQYTINGNVFISGEDVLIKYCGKDSVEITRRR